MKAYLYPNGLVATDPHSDLCGLWPEAIPKLLETENVEYFLGYHDTHFPLEKKDVEYLNKTVCRDEILMLRCLTLVTEFRKLPGIHTMPASFTDAVNEIRKRLLSKGRTV